MDANKAFTFIELLIVAAIIGILAAIAVPAYRDALIRSKTARVHADLNAIGIAIDSYVIDHSVTPRFTSIREPAGIIGNINVFRELTTPVSYLIHQALTDPFRHKGRMEIPFFNSNPFYYDYGGIQWIIERQDFSEKKFEYEWILCSVGPDINSGEWESKARYENGHDTVGIYSYPRQTSIFRYDASNGLISNGDIYRFSFGRPYPYNITIDFKRMPSDARIVQ